jgi:putative spermidine/putrescine transport system permease protein
LTGRRYSIFGLIMSVVLVAPLVVAVAVSFNPGEFMAFPPQGISLRWFSAAVGNQAFTSAFWFSVRVALLVTVVGLVIGVPSAVALVRARGAALAATRWAVLGPLVVPEILLALGLLILFNHQVKIGGGVLPIVLGHTIIALPLAVQVLAAGLVRIDASLESAAWTLGASRLRAFTTVTLPQVLPAVAGSAVFTFVVSFDNINISLFLAKPGEVTLPVQMYEYLSFRADPTVAAMSTLLVAMGVVAWLIASRLGALGQVNRVGALR